MDSGLAYTIVRPNSFMQNYINYFGGMIRDQQSIFLSQGQGRISLIDVRDIAAVDAEILASPETHRQKVYDLTGPEALNNEEIARILSGSLESLSPMWILTNKPPARAWPKWGRRNGISA